MELAILLLKFNLGNIFMEACYRCFVAPRKYFKGVAIVCIVAHILSACACMQSGSPCNIQWALLQYYITPHNIKMYK